MKESGLKSALHRIENCLLALVAFTTAAAQTLIPPPPTPAQETAEEMHGIRVADPYRWLENAGDPKVESWSDAQNLRTRGYLDALPGRESVKAELGRLIRASSPSYGGFAACGERVFAMYFDPKYQQPMLVALNAAADPESRKTLINPNAFDATGRTTIDWFVPSGDGSKVAVSLSKNGSEDGTLHVFDAETGKEIESPIDRVQYPTAGGSLAWASDHLSFWYTRYPGLERSEADRHFHMQVYFHRLGRPVESDTPALGSKDGLERISEVFLDNKPHLDFALAKVQRGDGNDWAFYLLRPDAPPLRIGNYGNQTVAAEQGADGAIYAVSRKGAGKGEILKLSPPFVPGGLDKARILIPATDAAILSDGLVLSGSNLFVHDIIGGPIQVRRFSLDGVLHGTLPLPPVAASHGMETLRSGEVVFDVTTYLTPTRQDAWNPGTGKVRETGLGTHSPVNFDDAEVERVFATSKDGTKVPVNLIRKKGAKRDRSNPLLLYGYGGYGLSMTPRFLGPFGRLWLDAGGIYAVANIRGGAEFGEEWHEYGRLTKKQNVFDDFEAAARAVIDMGYTSNEKLALMGGSNGGLLMGATLTQHPSLARAVVSSVGIYDMIRVELDPNGSFNTTEFGTVKNPAEFRALLAYSPYHHVTKGTVYPALLMMTGATDGRVNPMQSRKFAAALQAATGSSHPILLRTDKAAGHGMGSSLDQRIEEGTDELMFLFDQLGMTWRGAAMK
jgi:prolyl oligopeptidase